MKDVIYRSFKRLTIPVWPSLLDSLVIPLDEGTDTI
jgi:hypothetical protein